MEMVEITYQINEALDWSQAPLLVRTSVLPGESLLSLLMRLALLNGYAPPSLLTNFIEAKIKGRAGLPDNVVADDNIYGAGDTTKTQGNNNNEAGASSKADTRLPDSVERPFQVSTYAWLSALTRVDPLQLYAATPHHFAHVLMPPGSQVGAIDLSALTLTSSTSHAPSTPAKAASQLPLLAWYMAARQLHSVAGTQFCPLCLRADEVPYHRLIWLPQAVAVCLRHRCILLRKCPRCRKKVKVSDVVSTTCSRCKASILEAEPTTIANDSFGLYTQQLIQSWFAESKQAAPPEPALSIVPTVANTRGTPSTFTVPDAAPAVLYRILQGLRYGVMHADPVWEYMHRVPQCPLAPSVLQICLPTKMPSYWHTTLPPSYNNILYATATKGLIDWPRGFYDFLSALRSHHNQNQCTQRSERTQPAYMPLPPGGRQEHRHERQSGADHREGATHLSPTSAASAANCDPHALRLEKPLTSVLGRLYYGWLEQEWQHPAFSFVQDAFNKYLLLNEMKAPPLGRGRHSRRYKSDLDFASKFDYVPLTEVEQSLGINRQAVVRLASLGRLTIYERHNGGGRARYVKRVELDELRETWSNLLALEQVASALDVSTGIVEELIRKRLLRAERGPDVEGSRHWLCSPRAVDEFMDKLSTHIVCIATHDVRVASDAEDVLSTPEESLLTLDNVLGIVLAAVGLTPASLLADISEGKLRTYYVLPATLEFANRASLPAHRPMSLAALRFSRRDIELYIEEVKTTALWMGCLEAAGRIGVYNYSVVKAWAERGLLPATSMRGGEYRFHPDTVERFITTYVTIKEAANKLGVGVMALQAMVRAGRLVPISGSGPSAQSSEGVGECSESKGGGESSQQWQMCLFRREDVDRLPHYGYLRLLTWPS